MEPKTFRTCLDCGLKKKTTVSLIEETDYYCEDCMKKTARIAYEESSPRKGLWILVVVAVIAFLLGKFVF